MNTHNRSKRPVLALSFAFCAVVLAGCGDEAIPTAVELAGDPEVVSFIGAMNSHRESVGCEPLLWHDGTGDVAQAHSQDMVDRDFFAHTNPDGVNPFQRLGNAGVEWSGPAGENIALTSGGAESALSLWLNSSGHRQNIENCSFTHHGVGLAGRLWTHLFITNPE